MYLIYVFHWCDTLLLLIMNQTRKWKRTILIWSRLLPGRHTEMTLTCPTGLWQIKGVLQIEYQTVLIKHVYHAKWVLWGNRLYQCGRHTCRASSSPPIVTEESLTHSANIKAYCSFHNPYCFTMWIAQRAITYIWLFDNTVLWNSPVTDVPLLVTGSLKLVMHKDYYSVHCIFSFSFCLCINRCLIESFALVTMQYLEWKQSLSSVNKTVSGLIVEIHKFCGYWSSQAMYLYVIK